jgi:hypothetical protein
MSKKVHSPLEISTYPRPAHEVILMSLALIPLALVLASAGAIMLVYADELPTTSVFLKRVVATLGSFLLVGSTFNFIWRILYRRAVQERQKETITALFRAELSRLIPKVVLFGLTNIEDRMDYGALFDSLQPGDELWWLDTYTPGYEDWRASLREAIERGARIKMLVLKPGCDSAKLRAKEISSEIPLAAFEKGLEQFYIDMVARANKSPNAMEVRTYTDLIGCPIYLIERKGHAIKAISSLYLNPASFDFPHFVWEDSNSGQIIDALAKYVKDKWEKNAPKP